MGAANLEAPAMLTRGVGMAEVEAVRLKGGESLDGGDVIEAVGLRGGENFAGGGVACLVVDHR